MLIHLITKVSHKLAGMSLLHKYIDLFVRLAIWYKKYSHNDYESKLETTISIFI